MDIYVAASQQEPQPASTMVTNDIDKSLSIPQRPHLQVRACMRALFAAAARARTCTCALVHAYSRAVTLPPFLAAPSTPLRFLLASPTSPPHLAAPPRRPTSPPRFAAPSSPPHLAAPSSPLLFASPSSPPHLTAPPCWAVRLALWGPEPVAAPSPRPDRWRLCLQAPTCLHQFTCPYRTDARGQSHHPLACLYSTDARGQSH